MHKIYSKENKEKLETGHGKMLCVTDEKQKNWVENLFSN